MYLAALMIFFVYLHLSSELISGQDIQPPEGLVQFSRWVLVKVFSIGTMQILFKAFIISCMNFVAIRFVDIEAPSVQFFFVDIFHKK